MLDLCLVSIQSVSNTCGLARLIDDAGNDFYKYIVINDEYTSESKRLRV